jgi:uncharacterized pyridoxal phosphate-containing UPF0001 family protein
VAGVVEALDVEVVRANRERVEEELAAAARTAGRQPGEIELCAAVKYVPVELLGVLADAGLTLLGENRAQDLSAKRRAHPDRFTWDFIGALQSRKVKGLLADGVRLIHSVASDSALAQLERHGHGQAEVLVEVNIACEAGKAGVDPAELPAFLERARAAARVTGLMTMPPAAERPEDSRRHFAALRELADAHGLARLSMGTSQDYVVAAEEGATIVRLGATLYEPVGGARHP